MCVDAKCTYPYFIVSICHVRFLCLLCLTLADLTEVCDMEEDKAYIAKKCADLRAQYNQLVKMARDAVALCNIRERQKLLQHCIHRCVCYHSGCCGSI